MQVGFDPAVAPFGQASGAVVAAKYGLVEQFGGAVKVIDGGDQVEPRLRDRQVERLRASSPSGHLPDATDHALEPVAGAVVMREAPGDVDVMGVGEVG